MVTLVVSADQAERIRSLESIEIVDPTGRQLRLIEPLFTKQEVAEARRLLSEPYEGLTTDEVLAKLEKLEAQ